MTRSHRILGALAAAALAVAPGLAAEPTRTMQVGRQQNGTVVLTNHQVLEPAGTTVEFRGRPNAIALSPDGKTAAFLNGTYSAIILVDVATVTVKQEFASAGTSASFTGIHYSADGTKLYATQANKRVIVANVGADGTLAADGYIAAPDSPIPYPGLTLKNSYPGGFALSADGTKMYLTLNRENSVGVFDLATRTLLKQIPVGNAPFDVLIDGKLAFVTNRGGRKAVAGDHTVDSSSTPIVADEDSGFPTTGTVSVIDLESERVVREIEVGLLPGAMLLDGGYLYVANTNSDSVSIIDRKTFAVRTLDVVSARIGTTSVKPVQSLGWLPRGLSPNALAMIHGRLLVSLPRANAIGVFRVSDVAKGQVEFEGLIPTGWYPMGIAADEATGRIVVANGKGVGSLGPEAKAGPHPPTNKTGKYVHSNMGSATVVAFPTPAQLLAYTERTLRNNGWLDSGWAQLLPLSRSAKAAAAPRKGVRPVPVPERLGEPSVFKHVFYIIKENRTYDQILSDLPQGNGDTTKLQFGREFTPNQHAISEQFALLDNTYDSGSNSADGHQWNTQAFVSDYVERSYGGFVRAYPFNGGDALVYTPLGFIWDNALRNGKSIRVYGEYTNGLRANGEEMGPWLASGFLGGGTTLGGTWADWWRDAQILNGWAEGELHADVEAHSDVPSLDRIINRDYPPYHMIISDQYRVGVFLEEFEQYVKNGNLPEFVIMALTNDHTEGTSPGYPTPQAMVADNDWALGRVIEAVSKSPYWKDTAIFVIEDDAQNGVDHVDGHRTIAYVASAYSKRGIVDSTYNTQVSFIRTMEQILGLPPMNVMDGSVPGNYMANLFQSTPDLTPFTSIKPAIPLDTMNPTLDALTGLQRQWAEASMAMDFSRPDAADEELLNRLTWYATRGYDVPYPGDERVLAPGEVHAYIDSRSSD
jgi:YVTN family beta-propeller protein